MLNPAIRAAGIELKMTEAEKADAILTLPCRISFSKEIVLRSCLSIELDIVRRFARGKEIPRKLFCLNLQY